MRQQSKFKIQEEEQSSSVVQTQCFISHSRCVDFLFNWMFVRACAKRYCSRGRRCAEEGRWVSITLRMLLETRIQPLRQSRYVCAKHACTWNHSHKNASKHTNTECVSALSMLFCFEYTHKKKLLGESVCEFRDDGPSGSPHLLNALYQDWKLIRTRPSPICSESLLPAGYKTCHFTSLFASLTCEHHLWHYRQHGSRAALNHLGQSVTDGTADGKDVKDANALFLFYFQLFLLPWAVPSCEKCRRDHGRQGCPSKSFLPSSSA